MAERVYAVEDDEELTMVIANSQVQAISHVAKAKYDVHTATALELAEYVAQGGVVEHANQKVAPEQTATEDEDTGE